ncbi:hypothetical protein AVEN_103329-1 [Araneus ventricosus]|uniref:Uncharacterized protein n=1 Tax=Araneus ventricosus TaxID=182803 RepID=A0A4Y2LVS6_ARAVE|nr:hypothetical protein AVEN_103329-1 [Araneus ventricosus]
MCTTTLIQGSPCALFPMDRWTTYRKQGDMCEVNHVSVPGAGHALPSTCAHPTDRQPFGFGVRVYTVTLMFNRNTNVVGIVFVGKTGLSYSR